MRNESRETHSARVEELKVEKRNDGGEHRP